MYDVVRLVFMCVRGGGGAGGCVRVCVSKEWYVIVMLLLCVGLHHKNRNAVLLIN